VNLFHQTTSCHSFSSREIHLLKEAVSRKMETGVGAGETDELVRSLKALEIASQTDNRSRSDEDTEEKSDQWFRSEHILILDAGYGFPREKKVRKEKINAISSQLSNFLIWQTSEDVTKITENNNAAVRVVGCPDENTNKLIKSRTIYNMRKNNASSLAINLNDDELPSYVTITCETLEECLKELAANRVLTNTTACYDEPVYLSPDAGKSLDPCGEPPDVAIVGLLIDRRVQPNRSRDRAENIGVVARRWPLEECFAQIDSHEPLNVDCVLEGMQQWWWNWGKSINKSSSDDAMRETFVQAAAQAIEHHAKRHPSRPLHITKHV